MANPDLLEDKLNVDLRREFYSGIVNARGLVHELSPYRVSTALIASKPDNIRDVCGLLQSIGFDPYVVLGSDDFEEMLKHGGRLISEDYAFSPPSLS